ncbi:hypothetical protein ACFLTH_10685 [Bacteroidota bacterium]
MSLFQNHAGLCLTNKKFQLVEIDYREDEFHLENVDEEPFDELFDSSIKEAQLIDILQNSFNRLIQRKPLSCKNVSFALHHGFFRIVELPYDDTLTNRDLLEHFNWELQLLFPTELPEGYFIRFIEVNKSNIRKERIALIIAVNKRLLNTVHKFCIKNEMSLKIADNIHSATNVFFNIENQSVENKIFLSLMIDEKDLSIVVVDEKNPVVFSVKQIEGRGDVIPVLEKEFEKYKKFKLTADNFSDCYVYGNDLNDNLIDEINSALNISLYKVNPFDKIKKSPHIYENEYFIEKYNSFAPAAGVALRLQ